PLAADHSDDSVGRTTVRSLALWPGFMCDGAHTRRNALVAPIHPPRAVGSHSEWRSAAKPRILPDVTQAERLALVSAVNLALVASLVLVGLLAHSLGVLASGADYLGDALGAALSLAAIRAGAREQPHAKASSLAA